MIHLYGLGLLTEEADEMLRRAAGRAEARQANLGGNELDRAPEALLGLALQALWAEGNKLRRFGAITAMRSLVLLDLSDNELDEIPEDVWRLASLKQLFLSNNEIKRLPRGMRKIRLRELDLRGNAELEEGARVAVGGRREVEKFLEIFCE